MCFGTGIQEGNTMKRTKILGALLAGVMAVSGISVIPGVSSPFVVEAEAASKLAAPTGLKATVSGTTVKLTWNAVNGADAYRVYKFDSESGEYKTLKNVSGTSTSVKNLAKGTYNFRVAAIVKSGSKLKAQTKSSPVKAKVTGATTTANSSAGALFNFPAFGTTGKKALQALGIKQYEYVTKNQNGTTIGGYAGGVKYNGKECPIVLITDKNDKYFGGCFLCLDKTVLTFADAYKKVKNSLGKPAMDMNMLGMNMYMWVNPKTSVIYTLMGMDDKQSMVMYYELSYTYAPKELTNGADLSSLDNIDYSSITSLFG